MRRLIIATFVSMAWIVPIRAQDAPHVQAAAPHEQLVAPNAAPDQTDPLKDAMQTIQQIIQARLASAGFTDIQMVPNSFLIIAKDRDGHPVTMMASPNSITESEDGGPGQDDGADDMPSSHPYTTDRGPVEEM